MGSHLDGEKAQRVQLKTSQWFLSLNNLFTARGKVRIGLSLAHGKTIKLRPWLVFCVVRAIKTSDCMRRLFPVRCLRNARQGWIRAPDTAEKLSFCAHLCSHKVTISIWLFIAQYMRKICINICGECAREKQGKKRNQTNWNISRVWLIRANFEP